MATEEVQLAEEEGGKSSSMKWIIIGVAAVVLLGGGVVGTLFALGMLGSEPAEAAAEDPASAVEEKKEAVYVSIQPPFTVNFSGNSQARFLQVGVDVMTRDPAVEEELKRHMPVIRNNLVLLFSSKTSSELVTAEGKQALQNEALSSIQKVLEDETGNKGVEAVYFTSFVMQ